MKKKVQGRLNAVISAWFFKNIVYSLIAYLKGYSISSDIKFFNTSQYNSQSEILTLQKKKLAALVKQAKQSEYHKNLTDFNLNDDVEQWLLEQPILEKESLRSFEQQMLTGRVALRDTIKTSGGSTGAAVTLYKNASAMSKELAATWRGYQWAGVNIGDLQARFWGIPHSRVGKLKAKLTDLVTHRIRYSAFNFSQGDLVEYTKSVVRNKPKYFYGYVSLMRELAQYVQSNSLQDYFDSVEAIITTSEVLTDADRISFENAFGAKVFNEYGCGEVGTIAHECEHGAMHINDENLLIEILSDEGLPLPIGQVGKIVVTDLNNQLMPLIRYNIGDMGSLSDEVCSCGRTLKILEGVSGRAYDLVKNKQGKVFHGEFFLYFIEELKSHGVAISGVQFLFDNDKVTIKLVCKDDDFEFLCDQIDSKLKEKFCSDVMVEFLKVDRIEREQSGKLRVVKNVC